MNSLLTFANSICQTPSKRRTDEETRRVSSSVRPSVRLFVRLSLSVVSVTGVHPMGE